MINSAQQLSLVKVRRRSKGVDGRQKYQQVTLAQFLGKRLVGNYITARLVMFPPFADVQIAQQLQEHGLVVEQSKRPEVGICVPMVQTVPREKLVSQL